MPLGARWLPVPRAVPAAVPVMSAGVPVPTATLALPPTPVPLAMPVAAPAALPAALPLALRAGEALVLRAGEAVAQCVRRAQAVAGAAALALAVLPLPSQRGVWEGCTEALTGAVAGAVPDLRAVGLLVGVARAVGGAVGAGGAEGRGAAVRAAEGETSLLVRVIVALLLARAVRLPVALSVAPAEPEGAALQGPEEDAVRLGEGKKVRIEGRGVGSMLGGMLAAAL